jgi:hypothetical protein
MLHAIWSSPTTLEAARRTATSWTLDDVGRALGANLPAAWANEFLAADENGSEQILLVVSSGSALRIFRDSSGWHTDPLPANFFWGLPLPSGEEGIRFVAKQGGVAIAFQPLGTGDIYLLDRTSAGWGQQLLNFALGQFPGAHIEAARSGDGARVVVTAEVSNGFGLVWTIGSSGVSHTSWFDIGTLNAAGFRADGKTWILAGLQDAASSDGTVSAMLFDEL